MSAKTLFTVVDSIQVSRVRLSPYQIPPLFPFACPVTNSDTISPPLSVPCCSHLSSSALDTLCQCKKERESNHGSIWATSEEKLFRKLIAEYGTDLTMIHSFFPTRTRVQIKKKFRTVWETHNKSLAICEKRNIRESRKCFFDEAILSQKLNLMKWVTKPNNSNMGISITSSN